MSIVCRMLIIALCSGCIATAALAQEPTLEETPHAIVKLEESVLTTGQRMIVVEDAVVGEVRNLVDFLLQSGRASAQSGNTDRAAEAFSFASAYMRVDAGRGHSKARERVVEEADLLKQLADLMAEGSRTEMKTIDLRIFGAHRALAAYHQDRAIELIEDGYNRQAGRALEASLVHYDHAMIAHKNVTGVDVEDEMLRQVEDLESIAQALMETDNSRGQQTATTDTISKVKTLGKNIRTLGRVG